MSTPFMLLTLPRLSACLASLAILSPIAQAQSVIPGVVLSTSATTSETFPSVPGPCTQAGSGLLTASIGGSCELPVTGGIVTFLTSAAGSRPDLQLSAGAQVAGSTSQSRVSFSDRSSAALTEALKILPRAGAPAADDVVFTGFMTGQPTGVAGLDGTYFADARFSLFVGEWGTSFTRLASQGGGQVAIGSLVAHVPFMLFASGGGANINLRLEVTADISTGFAAGTRTFSAGARTGYTGGLQSIRVLDSAGNDVSSFYEVRTSLGPILAVPEPATIFILAGGLAGLCGRISGLRVLARRRHREPVEERSRP